MVEAHVHVLGEVAGVAGELHARERRCCGGRYDSSKLRAWVMAFPAMVWE